MIKRILRLLLLLGIISSCSKNSDLASLSIGNGFINSQTNITVIDTFSINLSTFVIDSIQTSAPLALLVGEYSDEYFGKVKSKSFFKLGLSDSASIDKKAVLDSMTLTLKLTGDWYGDTISPQTIEVHRVLDNIKLNDDSKLYNNSSFQYAVAPIGTLTFNPKPLSKGIVQIKLQQVLAEEFMNKMKEKTEEFSSVEKFLNYFKGIALTSGTGNSSVLGFEVVDSFLNIKLHTHIVEEIKSERVYTFPLYEEKTCFNKIESDRSGTIIEKVQKQINEVSSPETGDMSYIEAGGGIVTRIDFPTLNRLLEFDTKNYLFRAEIILKPVSGSYSRSGLPKDIILYKTDKFNRLVSEITASDGSSLPANLYYDKLYNSETYYQFDVTDYISSGLNKSFFNPDEGLVISFPSGKFQGSLDRLVFDAHKNNSVKPVLKLYYLFYN